MRAIQITSLDGPDAVELVELPDLVADDLVTIEVKAAGVSFPDLLHTRGAYQVRPELPFTPGTEVAGVVIAAPAGSGFAAGDRVAALTQVGGFAEQVLAHPDRVFALPDEVSFEAGAALPLNYVTAYFALVERGGLAEGETVLVHGAAGGVGTAAIQMAKAFGASEVIAVVSTDAKGEAARLAGADRIVPADGFLEAVGKGSVDIVVDPVGGDRFTDSLRALRADGRLLVIGFTAGEIPQVKVNRLLLNNISVVGVGWAEYVRARPDHVAREWAAMVPHLRSGALAPLVGATYPLTQASAALRSIEAREVTGKAVLIP